MILIALVLDRILSVVLLLPLRDARGQHRTFSAMTWGLIVINVAIHVFFYAWLPWWLEDEEAWAAMRSQIMLVPADILEGTGIGALSMLTSAFLHAGWSHLLGNMFFLFFFGRRLEDVLGPTKFGLFYLSCVFVSGVASVLGRAALPLTKGMIPGLGASGAVMGVVAAYLFLYQDQRIRTLPMLFGILPIPISLHTPAWVFIVYTVTRDILNGYLEQQFQEYGTIYSLVGSFAHLGGVIAGLTCLYLFLPQELLQYRPWQGAEEQ